MALPGWIADAATITTIIVGGVQLAEFLFGILEKNGISIFGRKTKINIEENSRKISRSQHYVDLDKVSWKGILVNFIMGSSIMYLIVNGILNTPCMKTEDWGFVVLVSIFPLIFYINFYRLLKQKFGRDDVLWEL